MPASTIATDVETRPWILVTYRHGLRASEVCDLQWHQVELDQGRIHVRRAKNGTPSVHPIRGDEICALRKLRREKPERGLRLRHRAWRTNEHHRLPPSHPEARQGCQDAFPTAHPLTCCGMRAATSLPTTGTIPEPCSTISATRTSSTPSDTPSFHPTGSAISGAISVDWPRSPALRVGTAHGSPHLQGARMCVRQARPPGRGDFSVRKNYSCPLSPKTCPKTVCLKKGVAFLWKACVQKKFSGAGEDVDE